VKKIICLFVYLFAGSANATFIVSNTYSDVNSIQWTYLGQYDISQGDNWITSPTLYNGITGAEFYFGASNGSFEYAISHLNNDFVSHLANYEQHGTGGGHVLAEDYNIDLNGVGYTFGDYSTRVIDHGTQALNYVFTRDLTNQVPEPATLALLSLGLAGISFSRKKKIT
jgi:hypothetical protein